MQDNLDIIVTEGERLASLINDVLDIAKMEAGRIDWREDEVDVNAVVEQAVAATASLFEAREPAAGGRPRTGPAVDDRRPPPAGPGADQPALERGEVHRRGIGHGSEPADGRRVWSSRSPTPGRASRPTTTRSSSSGSSRWATRSPASRRAPAWACRSRRRSSSTTAAGSRVESDIGRGATFSFTLPVRLEPPAARLRRPARRQRPCSRPAVRAQPARRRRPGHDPGGRRPRADPPDAAPGARAGGLPGARGRRWPGGGAASPGRRCRTRSPST